MIFISRKGGSGGRDRSTARLTLGVGLAVSAFPLSVPVYNGGRCHYSTILRHEISGPFQELKVFHSAHSNYAHVVFDNKCRHFFIFRYNHRPDSSRILNAMGDVGTLSLWLMG